MSLNPKPQTPVFLVEIRSAGLVRAVEAGHGTEIQCSGTSSRVDKIDTEAQSAVSHDKGLRGYRF